MFLRLFKTERIEYRVLTVVVIASLIYFVGKICYAGIIALPYPKELLESSNVALTNLFVAGKNPYTVESLSWDIPGINYDYPPLNSLLAAMIVTVTHCDVLIAHFVVSLASIVGSGLIGFFAVKNCVRTTVAPMLTALLFMFCHWRFGYISAAPDDLGLFLMILTMYVATSSSIRNKPLACSVGITLCFYTKQYFVFVAVGIFIYMILYSRKDAAKLVLWSLVINVLIAAFMWFSMPLYRLKTFVFTYMGTVGGGGSKIATFIDQFKYLIVIFLALFAVIMYSAYTVIKRVIRNRVGLGNIVRVRENDYFALNAVTALTMIFPLLVIGRNDGAFLSYFLQLWIPSIVVVAIILFEKMIPEKKNVAIFCAYAMIAVFTIYFGFGKLPLHILTDDEIRNWEKAFEYIDKYSEKGDVFYSRSLAYEGFKRLNGEWMCGHDGEIFASTVEYFVDAGFPVELFPYAENLVAQNLNYREFLKNKGKEHGYSLITFESDDAHTVYGEKLCEEFGYDHIDTLLLRLGNMPYSVEFYAVEQ